MASMVLIFKKGVQSSDESRKVGSNGTVIAIFGFPWKSYRAPVCWWKLDIGNSCSIINVIPQLEKTLGVHEQKLVWPQQHLEFIPIFCEGVCILVDATDVSLESLWDRTEGVHPSPFTLVTRKGASFNWHLQLQLFCMLHIHTRRFLTYYSRLELGISGSIKFGPISDDSAHST